MLNKNEGSLDRFIRILLGIVMMAVGFGVMSGGGDRAGSYRCNGLFYRCNWRVPNLQIIQLKHAWRSCTLNKANEVWLNL